MNTNTPPQYKCPNGYPPSECTHIPNLPVRIKSLFTRLFQTKEPAPEQAVQEVTQQSIKEMTRQPVQEMAQHTIQLKKPHQQGSQSTYGTANPQRQRVRAKTH
jgi:hypothetical protein